MKNKKIDLIKENYSWIIAIVTIGSLALSQVIRFFHYIQFEMYKAYYGINISSISYQASDLIYGTIISAIFLSCFYAMLMCYKHFLNNIKIKKYKSALFNLFIILVVNWIFTISNSQVKFSLYEFISFIILEIIFVTVISFVNKGKKKDVILDKAEFQNNIIMFPFVIAILITNVAFQANLSYSIKREYRIINNDQVVVYYDDKDYILLNCDIKDKTLIIYYGTQKRTSSLNIDTKNIKFEKVLIEK